MAMDNSKTRICFEHVRLLSHDLKTSPQIVHLHKSCIEDDNNVFQPKYIRSYLSNCLNFDIYKDCKDVPKFSLHLLVRISNLVLAKQPRPRLLVVIYRAHFRRSSKSSVPARPRLI